MNNRFLKKGIIMAVVLLGILFVMLCVLFISSFLVTNNNQSNEIISKIYQYSEFDPSTNHSSVGFVKLNKIISKEDSLSYRKETNTGNNLFVVISNLVDQSYECYGTCICSEESNYVSKNSRRTTAVFQKSLYFILAAFSTLMAVKIAHEYFRDECHRYFENSNNNCEEKNIEVEVNRCFKEKSNVLFADIEESHGVFLKDLFKEEGKHEEEIFEDGDVEEEEEEEEEETSNGKEEEGEDWSCTGNCIPFEDALMTDEKYVGIRFFKNFFMGGINKRIDKLCSDIMLSKITNYAFNGGISEEKVRESFRSEILRGYCKEESKDVNSKLRRLRDKLQWEHNFCFEGRPSFGNVICKKV